MSPCFENQKEVQDKLKIDPLVARAFLNETLEHMKPYLDATGTKRDGLSAPDAIQKVANDSGLSPQTVGKIIQSESKLFSITKQAFNRQAASSAAKQAGRTIAENGAPRNAPLTRAFNDMRRLVLAGHSPVFPFTHARNLLFGRLAEKKIFTEMVHDAWSFRGKGQGDVNHATAVAEMKSSKNYDLAQKAGLVNKPGTLTRGDLPIERESGTVISRKIDQLAKYVGDTPLGRKLRLDPQNAVKTFDALMVGRQKLFDFYWDKTPPELKTEAYARMLARDMNYATGAVGTPIREAARPIDRLVQAASDATGNVLLSSKLFYAKRMEGANILRYGPGRLANLLTKGGRMTPEERAIANLGLQRWGIIAAHQLGIIGANYAFAKHFGLHLPNITDPDKADWGRMRIGNFVVPLSPLMEVVREPIRAVAAGIKKRSAYEGGKEVARPIINALTPGLQTGIEQVTGKEPFSGRTVPSIRNVIQPPKTKSGGPPPISLTEYATTRLTPIAISGGLHEFYQELRNQGVEPSMATALIKSAAGAATSGLAGTHIYEEQPKPQKAPKTGRGKKKFHQVQ